MYSHNIDLLQFDRLVASDNVPPCLNIDEYSKLYFKHFYKNPYSKVIKMILLARFTGTDRTIATSIDSLVANNIIKPLRKTIIANKLQSLNLEEGTHWRNVNGQILISMEALWTMIADRDSEFAIIYYKTIEQLLVGYSDYQSLKDWSDESSSRDSNSDNDTNKNQLKTDINETRLCRIDDYVIDTMLLTKDIQHKCNSIRVMAILSLSVMMVAVLAIIIH